MSNPTSKEDKKARILAALEGRAIPAADSQPAAPNAVPVNTGAKSADSITGMMDRSPKATTKVIGDFVDDNPDKALAVFRNWMSE